MWKALQVEGFTYVFLCKYLCAYPFVPAALRMYVASVCACTGLLGRRVQTVGMLPQHHRCCLVPSHHLHTDLSMYLPDE